jgi:serine/threonine-protein kinase
MIARQPKRAALLAYLVAAQPRGLHRRDKIVALFWPELDARHARNALSQALHVLRHGLRGHTITTRGEEEVGVNADALSCDLTRFEEALDAGRPTDALALYRGDLLDGLYVGSVPEFERWVDGERERVRRRAVDAAGRAADAEDRAGQQAGAVSWATRAAEISPYDDTVIRRLIGLLDRVGDRAGAIRAYRNFQRRLRTDLEVDPSPETSAQVDEIRARLDRLRASIPTSHDDVPDVHHQARTAPRPRLRPALVVLGLLAAFATSWLIWSPVSTQGTGKLASTASATRIAVFPFRVQAGPELAYLSEGAMDVLSEAIDGLGELRRVQPYALMSRLRRQQGTNAMDAVRAGRVTRDLGARRWIAGTIVELGNQVSISASLYDLTAGPQPLTEAHVQGKPERLAPLLSELARKLIADIPVGAGARLERVGMVAPANFGAFKAYLQGEALLRRGSHDSAAVKFAEAVQTDSTFAIAWYRLGLVWGLTQSFGLEGDDYTTLARAFRHRDRLSLHDRQLVDAWRAHFYGQPEVAERLAREVVGSYPDDAEAWHLLGLTRMWYAWQRGRPFGDARYALDRALTIDPFYPDAVYHAFALAVIDARYTAADSLMRIAPKVAAGPWAVANRGLLTFTLGDQSDQANFTRSLRDADDQTLLTVGWMLGDHTDSLGEASRVFIRLTDDAARSDWARTQATIFLAHVEAARGRWQDARARLVQSARWDADLALSSYAWLAAIPLFNRPLTELTSLRDSLQHWQMHPVTSENHRLRPQVVPDVLALPAELRPWIKDYLLGLLSARLRDVVAAEHYAARLETAAHPRDTVGLRHDLALEIRGLAALEGGNPALALHFLEQARMTVATSDQAWYPRYYSRPFGRFLRAEALRQLDRFDEALAWYATFGEKYGTEFAYHPAVFLRQAQIYERRGDSHRALACYQHFLARWQTADTEYRPLVRDVERHVARLSLR